MKCSQLLFSWRGTFVVSFIAILLSLMNALAPSIGRMEGDYFPVVTDSKLLRIQSVEENSSRIWGIATRKRNCEFESLEWRYGTPGNSALVSVTFEETAKNRGLGPFSFGAWLVQLTPYQLQHSSFAVAVHNCHPFWKTRTSFFP